jgi:oligopeptide/dipeptide ABC transporter ATP-binding protein
MTLLLQAENLRVTFRSRGRRLHAVDGVDVSVSKGETVALVGESGSGKSTVALTLMRAHPTESGRIVFDGVDITRAGEAALKPVRRRMQMVFQDPYSSLSPRLRVHDIIAEPLRAHGIEIAGRVQHLLAAVGLAPDAADRMPAEFSGGQRQRIAIARALALEPSLLIADEPVSALDVSIQAQIVNLLRDIQERLGIAYLVIAHDLAFVHQIADRVVVMYLGQVVEEGTTDEVIGAPQHPYTVALISAAPAVAARSARIVLQGEPPSPIDRPSGCRFHPRCPIARPRCAVDTPVLEESGAGRRSACFYPGELPSPLDLA